MSIKLYLFLFYNFIASIFFAQDRISLLDSIIEINKYTISQNDKGFSGTGFDYIIDNCKNVQFVGIAENHYTKEIPQFTSFLFDKLHQFYLFNYLAIEQDVVMMNLLSSKKYDVAKIKI